MRTTLKTQFSAGESLAWEKTYSDYDASDGWVLTYYFRGTGTGFDIEATASGSKFVIVVPSTATETMVAGQYSYQGFVEKGTERIQVDSGTVQVFPSLVGSDVSATFDGRSEVKKILDAIDATIAGKATSDQLEYTIGNRQLRRYEFKDLILLRDKYQNLYNQEVRRENSTKGGKFFGKIKMGFTKPKC